MMDPQTFLAYSKTAEVLNSSIEQEHQHSFTIPVEWKTTRDYSAEKQSNDYPFIRDITVTKLRCSGCSEEVERS